MNTALAELKHIIIAGERNAGKSSLLNALFQKEVAIASPVAGTTTDPVTRKIELGKLGMCAITDTAGLDDVGELGQMRVDKTLNRLEKADLIIVVSPQNKVLGKKEEELLSWIEKKKKPYIGVLTFKDQNLHPSKKSLLKSPQWISLSNLEKGSSLRLIKKMETLANSIERELTPVEGIVKENDLVLLVTPIDLAAPAGRLIMPQVETIRDLLDRDCSALIVKERELYSLYNQIGIKPSLVITDSQAFHKVAADIPEDQPLTSFSILFARKKGDPSYFIKSLRILDNFPPKGRVFVFESCSHHRQADDLGTVKIPRLFRQLVAPEVEFVHGRELPKDRSEYDLMIHCGACMVTKKTMDHRLELLKSLNMPIINYGLFLAWANGLLPRALEPFDDLYDLYTREYE